VKNHVKDGCAFSKQTFGQINKIAALMADGIILK
jgi:hypothetical protein